MPNTLPLPTYVPPSQASPLGRVGREIDGLLDAMRAAFPEDKRRAFALSMAVPRNVDLYETGYAEGRHQGFAESFRDFKLRLSYTLDLFYSLVDPAILPDLVAGSISVYLQPDGTPLPPELKRRFEAALWYQQLQGFVPFFETLQKGEILDTLTLLAAEVVAAMREAGPAWVDGFFALTGDPRAQGRYAGYLIGRACGEVFFMAIEEITQVPTFAPPPAGPDGQEGAP
jgi:hypothetical protein